MGLGRYKYMERNRAVVYSRGPPVFQISGNHLKLLGSRRVTNQIAYWRPTSVRCHRTKCYRPRSVHPWLWVGDFFNGWTKWFPFHLTWTSIAVFTVSGHWDLICPRWIIPSTHRSSTRSFSARFIDKNYVCISLFPYEYCVSCESYHWLFNHLDSIRRRTVC
jgi:hypothetical protein